MADKNSSQPVRKKTYTAEEAAKLLQESDSELSESDEISESEDGSSFDASQKYPPPKSEVFRDLYKRAQ